MLGSFTRSFQRSALSLSRVLPASGGPPPAPTLNGLALSADTVAENSAPGTLVGTLLNTTALSTLSLIDSAGGRFALSGANIVTGATNIDYEAGTSYPITVRETLAGATNSPRDSVLTVNVTDVVEAGTVTLSAPVVLANGAEIEFTISGGAWSGLIAVDPSKVAITGTVPSADATGGAVNAVITRAAGYRATLVGGKLRMWLAEAIPSIMTGVSMTMLAGAIVAGSDVSNAFSGSVTNNSTFASPIPTARILGLVQGRSSLKVAWDIIDGPFAVEAAGKHEGGTACWEFTVTDGTTTVTRYATQETRSRYQGTVVIDNAQWDANRTGGDEGGTGVFSSGLIDPSVFADGLLTVTVRHYPKVGGLANSRIQTWQVCNNKGGYTQRVRYVDSVAGNDGNDGLTAGTAVQTLQRGVLLAGAAVNGATAKSIPIVRLVGGTVGSPRTYQMYNGTGSGTAVAGSTDTWLTIEPAEGHSRDTVRIANYTGTSTGLIPRIRRLKFRNITHDIAAAVGSTSSNTLLAGSNSVFPNTSNPGAYAFEGCRTTHQLGKNGQLTEGNSGNYLGSGVKEQLCFFINHEFSDMNQRGIQAGCTILARNCIWQDVSKDVFKEPDCVWEFGAVRNRVAPRQMPVSQIPSGQAPQAGDELRGLFSGYVGTVESYVPTNATSGTVILTAGGDSFGFKRDDSLTHTLVTISGVSGTFQVGEVLRNAAGSVTGTIREVNPTTLRVQMISGTYSAGTLTGVTSGATATWVSNATQQNINVVRGGSSVFRMQTNPPHPDGLQVQTFTPQELTVTGVTGSFQVGDVVSLTSPTRTFTVASLVQDGTTWYLTSASATTSQWVGSAGGTITGSISGATGTFVSARHVQNDFNMVMANGYFRECDGQLLFGENGRANVSFWNILGARLNTEQVFFSSFLLYGVYVSHVTLANQAWRAGVMLNSGSDATDTSRSRPLIGSVIKHSIFRHFTTDLRAAGAASSDDAGLPGMNLQGNHIRMTGGFSELTVGVSIGDPLFVDGVGPDEDDAGTKNNYRLQAGSPARNRVPAGQLTERFDILGRLRANDGAEAAGVMAA